MVQQFKAIFQDRTLVRQSDCYFPEQAFVELSIKKSRDVRSGVIDSEARKQIIKMLLQRLRRISSRAHPQPSQL